MTPLETPELSGGHERLVSTFRNMKFLGSFTFGCIATVRILHLEAIGIPNSWIAGLMAMYSVMLGVFEVPSGAFADVWGRQRIKMISLAILLGAFLVLAAASSALVVGIGLTLLALSRALASGATESWFVDEVGDAEHPSVLGGLAQAEAASNIGVATGALVGGFLPWLLADRLDPVRLLVPVFAVAAFGLIVDALLTLARMKEHAHRVDAIEGPGIWQTTVSGLRMVFQSTVPRWVAFSFFGIGALNATVELLTPLALSSGFGIDTGVLAFGILIAVAWFLSAYTAARSPVVEAWAGTPARAAGLTMFVVVAVTLPAALNTWVGPGFGYLGLNVAAGPVVVLLGSVIHRHVDSAHRSTAISTLSLSTMAGATLGSILVSVVSSAAVILVGAGLTAAALGLLKASRGVVGGRIDPV